MNLDGLGSRDVSNSLEGIERFCGSGGVLPGVLQPLPSGYLRVRASLNPLRPSPHLQPTRRPLLGRRVADVVASGRILAACGAVLTLRMVWCVAAAAAAAAARRAGC